MTFASTVPERINTVGLPRGYLQEVHHIALNVKDLQVSKAFYGETLGLKELQGAEVPNTLQAAVAACYKNFSAESLLIKVTSLSGWHSSCWKLPVYSSSPNSSAI
jgi:Glyoxalase/Bleomycin resistance protein/Dioxygenase superfamily